MRSLLERRDVRLVLARRGDDATEVEPALTA
jgi:hypothetical protein